VTVTYPVAICTVICERICNGESLRSICAEEDMPAKSTVMRWLNDPECRPFRDQYARAREVQADCIGDEILEIADDGTNDFMERVNKDGSVTTTVNQENIGRSRLRVDSRFKLMTMLAPKKYGPKVELEHGGEIGVKITKIERVIVDPKKESA
jgi:hypothetical protein